MSLDKQQHDDLRRLVSRLCDDVITDDEMERLTGWLESDAEALSYYVQYLEIHTSLAWTGSSRREPGDLVCAPGQRPWANLPTNVVHFFAKPTPLSLTVAALVIGVLLGALAFVTPPVYRAIAGRPIPAIVEQSPEVIARITGHHRLVLSSDQSVPPTGAALNPGRRLEFDAGLLELKFEEGAVAVLQGPAICIVEGRNKFTLERGKLLATVPKSAIGFEVVAPAVSIVDLGTKFGVEVSADRSGEVHVLTGSVELRTADDSEATGRILNAGEAWQFNAGGQQGKLAQSDPLRFALALPKPQVAEFQNGQVVPEGDAPYVGAEDVMLIQWARAINFGLRPDFDVGQNQGQPGHALLRFDLSALRGKVDRVLSATLVITPNTDVAYFPWDDTGEIALYQVSQQNSQWRQGVSGGAPPAGVAAGDATWDRLSHPEKRWTGSHGASSAGVDHGKTPLAVVPYAIRTNYPLEFRIAGDLQFVQDWIDGKANAGFLLKEMHGAADSRINFHSSESVNTAARPRLVIQYMPLNDTPIPAPNRNETELP